MTGALTDPFFQGSMMQDRQWRPEVLAPNTPVRICNNNPARVALFIVRAAGAFDLMISPFPNVSLASLAHPGPTLLPTVIHMSVFPVLTQEPWWACSETGGTIFVSEVILKRKADD